MLLIQIATPLHIHDHVVVVLVNAHMCTGAEHSDVAVQRPAEEELDEGSDAETVGCQQSIPSQLRICGEEGAKVGW